MLGIAPLIHTRAYQCDFNSGFMVRPEKFQSSEVAWARKLVLAATSDIDDLIEERWMVAQNGKYKIAGVVTFIKNLAQKCGQDKTDNKKFYYDVKNRPIYAFIGIVITGGSQPGVELTRDYLFDLYIQHLEPVWERRQIDTILCPFKELPMNLSSGKRFSEPTKPESTSTSVRGITLYESNTLFDKELFDYYVNSSSNFCSNLSDPTAVESKLFSVVTTSQNVISRLKRNVSASSSSGTAYKSNPVQEKPVSQQDESPPKKKGVPPWVWGLILIAVGIFLFLASMW